MSWMEVLQNIGIASAALGALAWVSRKLIDHAFEKRLSEFQDKLERDAMAFKHTLELQASQHLHLLEQASMVHRVRFESLHAKRAELIVELYQESCLGTWKLFEFVSILQEGGDDYQAECGIKAAQMAHTFHRKVLLSRIYFSPELSELLVSFASNLYRCARNWHEEYKSAKRENRNPYFGDRGEMSEFGKAHKKVDDELLVVTQKLEIEFRALLGVGASDEALVPLRKPQATT